MSGSRHEKASITIASYVIGFTTAFILYANISTPNQSSYPVPTVVPAANVATVVSAVPERQVAEKAKPKTTLSYNDGVLEITVDDTINLLSFNPEITEAEVDTTELPQGFHYGDIEFSLSPEQNFVFFCERHDKEDSNCAGFVYDVNADRIYQIIKDGSPVAITKNSAKTAIWTLFGLKIGDHYSANPKAPWVLISADSPLDLR